jgi:hypothetical protein
MKSSVVTGIKGMNEITLKDGQRVIVMDNIIWNLRGVIWDTIFKKKGKLSDCEIAMALGIVQYELIHHTKEEI